MGLTSVMPLTVEQWNQREAAGWNQTPEQIHLWTTFTQIRVALRDLSISAHGGQFDRQLMADEMDTIRAADFRASVETHQSHAHLMVNGRPLWVRLSWKPISGGMFGPLSSREALSRRTTSREEKALEQALADEGLADPPPPERNADRRGGGWVMGLVCPKCELPNRRLLRSEPGAFDWGCAKCKPANSLSSRWPHFSGNSGAGTDERLFRKHSEAAARLAVRLLQAKHVRGGGMQAPAHLIYEKPGCMRWERFMAICRVIDAHRMIADTAYMRGTVRRVNAIAPGCLGTELDAWGPEMEQSIESAKATIRRYRWATSKANHLRQGKPSNAPGEHTRRKALRTQGETSTLVA